MSKTVLVILVVFIEMFLHYFPWRLILHGRKLPRLIAYGLGVLGLMGPFTAWLTGVGNRDIAITLWTVLVAGGLAVGGVYFFDWLMDRIWSDRESRQREMELKERLNGKGQ